jgi:hypothetical protein
MFFYIGKSPPLSALFQVDHDIYLDKGWEFSILNDIKIWYKGYSTDCTIKDSLSQILDGYLPNGKWCVITKYKDSIKLLYPTHIGFPLYQTDKCLTNLYDKEYNFLGTTLAMPNDSPSITMDEAIIQIENILLDNIEKFYQYNKIQTINLLFSAGLDTLTVWALLDFLNIEYNLDVYIPKKDDRTLSQVVNASSDYGSELITFVRKNYWGYEISRIFESHNWNITGFYAERHQLRAVDNIVLLSNFMGKSIFDMVSPDDYLYKFIYRPDIYKKIINQDEQKFASETELKKCLYRSIYSDNQMWHIDNTFHFSPFFDRRITDIVYRMSLDDMILNFRSGYIQRKIIERTRPDFLSLVSRYKNCGQQFENFNKNWPNIKLTAVKNISIR